MNLNEFQAKCMATAMWPIHRSVDYPVLALAGEAGELANKLKKIWRAEQTLASARFPADQPITVLTDEQRKVLADEAMDCMYYAAAVLADLGLSLEDGTRILFGKLGERHGVDYDKLVLREDQK